MEGSWYGRFEFWPIRKRVTRSRPRPPPQPGSPRYRTYGVKKPHRYPKGTTELRERRRYYLCNSTPLHQTVIRGEEKKLRQLLKRGAKRGVDINARDGLGRTALHLTIEYKEDTMFKMLVESGADVDVRDLSKSTVLHLVVTTGNETLVRQLLEAGADINAANQRQLTALHIAASRGYESIVRLLLKCVSRGREKMVTRLYRKKYIDLGVRTKDGSTALHEAANNGHTAVVRVLLTHGADINAKNEWDWTPLHQAACNGRDDVVNLLLERDAMVGPKTSTGESPMDLAVQNRRINIVYRLIAHGASIPDGMLRDGNSAWQTYRKPFSMLRYYWRKFVEKLWHYSFYHRRRDIFVLLVRI